MERITRALVPSQGVAKQHTGVGEGLMVLEWDLEAALGVLERTDEDISVEEVGGEEVCHVVPDAWYVVTRVKDARARVLELAEHSELPV